MSTSSASSASKPSGGWQPPTLEEMQAMLPQYQFVSLLGRGGMGAVFKAVQVTLDRDVAIKVLPGDLVADDDDAQFAERFKNEARTMAKMNHPAIVNVYDFGETKTGLLYIVMEFIDGTDVAQMIASQGKLPEDYALSITAHVGDALQYAHTHGVIHRDIKPANILINMDGAVKVADFGLAKAHDAAEGGLTKTNMAMGTPDFVAPEALISGIPLDGRADLYAMGVMLYQMLTGEIPRGIWAMPSTKLGTDPRFDGIIAKAMQTDREVRYQSAAELRQDLDTILTLPRAVIIQQQQAQAEATARATKALKQRQAASGPQRRPVSPPAHEAAPPPVKKGAGLGLVIGVSATLIFLAGLYFLLAAKEPKQEPEPGRAASTTVTKTEVNKSQNSRDEPSASKPSQPPSPAAAPKMTTPSVVIPSPPKAPTPSAPEPGWIDLFANMDVARDAVRGEWEMTSEGLVLKPGPKPPVCPFEFNVSPAEEYDYEIEFTLRGGFGDLSQILPVPGHWFLARMKFEGCFLGHFLDGKDMDNPERKDGRSFDFHLKKNRRYRSRVEVRRESLRLLIDDEEVVAFRGDFKRLKCDPAFALRDASHVGIAAHGSQIILHQARLRLVPVTETLTAKVPATSPPSPAPIVVKDAGPSHWKMRLQGRSGAFAVASSADGNTLVAAAPGSVHTSTDSGATWKSVPLAGKWGAVTSSADGTRLAVAGWDSSIHTSIDSGLTWTERPSGAHKWSGIACSADGMQLFAVRLETGAGAIHISKDGGATWVEKNAGGDWWSGVASSADGTHLVAVGNGWAIGGFIFVSKDSGETWSKRMTDQRRRWSSVASSADGTRLVVADGGFDAEGGQIYVSGDSGETWEARGVSRNWGAVSSSSTGHRLLAVVGGRPIPGVNESQAGNIHVSTDFGESWEAQDTPRIWTSAASSDDGTHLLAAATSGGGSQVYCLDVRSFEARLGGDPRLLQLNTGFTSRYESDAQKPYLAAVAALNQSYLANGVAKARAAAQSRGSLKEVVAFDEVKARVERGDGVPAVDEPGTPESLKSLRAIYRSALAKITAERDAKAAPLYDLYVKALDAYIAELTRGEKLDEAAKVKTLRNDLMAQRPQTSAVAQAPPTQPAKPATAPKPTTATPIASGSSWRTAAEFLVNNGGSFLGYKNGATFNVAKEGEIPSGKFEIHELNLDRSDSLLPPLKDADFQAFSGLRDLRRVWIRPLHPGLSEAAYAFLAENDELIALTVEGDPDFSSEKLAHAAAAKKLQSIRIVGAPQFTAQGIDKLAGAGSLTRLELLETGITDDGMRAIAACDKLQALFFNSTAVTASGFAALEDLKSLKELSAYGSSFDDEAAGSASKLSNLTMLDLTNTRITDAGLQKLRSLKKLNTLNLGGSPVTVEAAAEFQKLMPQCRVSR